MPAFSGWSTARHAGQAFDGEGAKLAGGRSLALVAPTVLVRGQRKILVNPSHRRFEFDPRLVKA